MSFYSCIAVSIQEQNKNNWSLKEPKKIRTAESGLKSPGSYEKKECKPLRHQRTPEYKTAKIGKIGLIGN